MELQTMPVSDHSMIPVMNIIGPRVSIAPQVPVYRYLDSASDMPMVGTRSPAALPRSPHVPRPTVIMGGVKSRETSEKATDGDLVTRNLSGDSTAFDVLYHRYFRRVSSRVFRILASSHDVEQVVQDVFFQVHSSLKRFEARSSFYTWIYSIASNVALQHRRWTTRHRKDRSINGLPESQLVRPMWLSGSNPPRDCQYRELLSEVGRGISGLAPSQRTLMALGPIQGRSHAEIAGLVGLKTAVVKARLHRARKALRESLWKTGR